MPLIAGVICTLEKKAAKEMDDLIKVTIENQNGLARMTDLYEIMEHANSCLRCKNRFEELAKKNRPPSFNKC